MFIRNVVLTTFIIFAPFAHAEKSGEGKIKYGKYSTDTGAFYYELGGSEVIRPAYGAGKRATLRFQANASLGYSCGQFDPFENISQIMNNIKKGIDNLGNTITYGVGQAAAALPMYLLYEADPVMAQMITNARFSAEEAFKLSVKSCEQMEQSILSGNGYGDFVGFNMSKGLQKAAQEGQTATEAVKQAQNKGTCPEGIKWVGGKYAGGYKNKPIIIERDTVIAGYNTLRDDPSPISTKKTSNRLIQESNIFFNWPTPSDAANWVEEIIGTTQIKLCAQSNGFTSVQPRSAPGKGLMPIYEKFQKEFLTLLNELFYSPSELDSDDYRTIGIGMSGVIDSIKQMSNIQAEGTIYRLSSELALKRTIEMALNAKRLIRIGSQDIDVVAMSPSHEFIDKALHKIDIEISELSDNANIQRQYVYPTIQYILKNHGSKLSQSATQSSPTFVPPNALDNGAIRTTP